MRRRDRRGHAAEGGGRADRQGEDARTVPAAARAARPERHHHSLHAHGRCRAAPAARQVPALLCQQLLPRAPRVLPDSQRLRAHPRGRPPAPRSDRRRLLLRTGTARLPVRQYLLAQHAARWLAVRGGPPLSPGCAAHARAEEVSALLQDPRRSLAALRRNRHVIPALSGPGDGSEHGGEGGGGVQVANGGAAAVLRAGSGLLAAALCRRHRRDAAAGRHVGCAEWKEDEAS